MACRPTSCRPWRRIRRRARREKETPSRFRVEPEQPLVTFGVKDHKGVEPTGNPSIDAMHERDRRICRNIRRQALEKGKAQPFDGYIECP